MLSKKDIIELNAMFHTGKLSNESSLDFALDQILRSKNWLRVAAVLSRAVLIDHVFEGGNKRTAAAIIAGIMEMNGIEYDPAKIDAAVVGIARKNVTGVRQMEQVIKNARK